MKQHFLGFEIDKDFPELREGKVIINTINPHSFCVSLKDYIFKKALVTSNHLMADGVGITMANYLLYKNRLKRITGYDLHQFLLNIALKRNYRVFYLGASEETLSKIKIKLSLEYPNLSFEFHSPPFKDKFDMEENLEIINHINKFKPDILFVGMTAPKQEKWVYENNKFLNAQIICSIGAVFDYYAETRNRPSRFWRRLGLEWIVRFAKEPKRLYQRNLISTPKFIYVVFRNFFKINMKN